MMMRNSTSSGLPQRHSSAEKERLLAQAEREDVRVTYKADRKDWFVLSGLKGADGRSIIYWKVMKGCGAVHGVEVEYPASKRDLYDPAVTRLAEAMKCRMAALPR
jgi:hypothetical protein